MCVFLPGTPHSVPSRSLPILSRARWVHLDRLREDPASGCSASGGCCAMPSGPQRTPRYSPAAPARPLRGTATGHGTSAHDAGSTATPSRSCATTRGAAAEGAGTGTATRARTRVAEAGARARRGLPAPDRSRAGPPSRHRQPRYSAAPHPRAAPAPARAAPQDPRAGQVPEEPGNAARARSRRARDRRPQPRAGPKLEGGRAAPWVFLATSRHLATVTLAR